MNLAWSIAGYLALVGLVIALHELGHYLVARFAGIRVARFSLGIGKPLWRRTLKSGLEFTLCAFPVGGYVRFATASNPEGTAGKLLAESSMVSRTAVTLAGPAINIIAGALIFAGLAAHRSETVDARIYDVYPGTSLALAGALPGDLVRSIDGEPVHGLHHIALKFGAASMLGRATEWRVLRDGAELDLDIAPAPPEQALADPLQAAGMALVDLSSAPVLVAQGPHPEIRAGDRVVAIDGREVADIRALLTYLSESTLTRAVISIERDGQVSHWSTPIIEGGDGLRRRLGMTFAPARLSQVVQAPSITIPEAMVEGVRDAYDYTVISAVSLLHVIRGHAPLTTLSGPAHIAQSSGDALKGAVIAADWRWFFLFIAILNLGVGVVNLLPIPVLDGGQLLLIAAEFVRGRQASAQEHYVYQTLGLLMLGLMLIAATFADYLRFASP